MLASDIALQCIRYVTYACPSTRMGDWALQIYVVCMSGLPEAYHSEQTEDSLSLVCFIRRRWSRKACWARLSNSIVMLLLSWRLLLQAWWAKMLRLWPALPCCWGKMLTSSWIVICISAWPMIQWACFLCKYVYEDALIHRDKIPNGQFISIPLHLAS